MIIDQPLGIFDCLQVQGTGMAVETAFMTKQKTFSDKYGKYDILTKMIVAVRHSFTFSIYSN